MGRQPSQPQTVRRERSDGGEGIPDDSLASAGGHLEQSAQISVQPEARRRGKW